MRERGLDTVIAGHPFLEGLPPRLLQILAGCAANARFAPGEFLIREGRKADLFFLIRDGSLAVETFVPHRGPVTIQTLRKGDVLGWSWLIPPYRWRFDARALETTLVTSLDGKCLREKCARDHELGYELLKRLAVDIAERLEATRLQLQDVYAAHA